MVWENGAILSVVNGLGYPDDAARSNHAVLRELGLPLMRALLAADRGDTDAAVHGLYLVHVPLMLLALERLSQAGATRSGAPGPCAGSR